MKSCPGRKNLFVVLVCTVVLCLATGLANGRTINVRADGTGDYPTIQNSIDDSNDGDIIEVAPGTYTGHGNRDIDFLGKAITVRSENGPENCIIDCNGTETDPHRGFYFHSGEDGNSVLEGFTITNGYAAEGGGIYCERSGPMIINCTIGGNYGGGISCGESSIIIKNCDIIGNTGEVGGGIAYASLSGDSILRITNCTVSGNSAKYEAGGISFAGSPESLTITNSTITNNSAGLDGGGIFYFRMAGAYLTITNCTITGNSGRRGGGIYCYRGNSTINNCVISGNSAEGKGGAIYCMRSNNAIITNCTLAANSATNGNALACDSPKQNYPSNVELTNCILWNDGNEVWNNDNSTITITYSSVESGWLGEGNIDADPCFALATDYHLVLGSACIDAGTNDPCDGLRGTDIEGTIRPLDGDGDANAVADMGAYEYNPNSPSIAISTHLVSFSYTPYGPEPAPQKLLIRNCGVGTLHWEIVEDCNWLQVSPTNSILTSQIDEVGLIVDPNGLTPGLHSYIFEVQDPNASNSPMAVLVVLDIGTILRVPEKFQTIQAAVNAAKDLDVVLVADDTYTGPGNRNINFKGKAITVRSVNGPNDCIIDCQNTSRGFKFDNGETADSILDGFTITRGSALVGGGIYCEKSSPAISNCTIMNSSAGETGGGIVCWDNSSPTITNCTISGNRADVGGGIDCYYQCNVTITKCTISGNTADLDGGGIRCISGSHPTITNCTISGNTAKGWGAGGIYCTGDSSPTLTNCNITDNEAGHGGGMVCAVYSPPIITNCTISGNSARSWGGGIQCSSGNPMITNSIISGNSAPSGGGIFALGSDPTIINCTISGNTASVGGAIYCADSNIIIINCILWGDNPEEIYVDNGTLVMTYCDVQDGWSGLGNIDIDPLFVSPGYWDANGVLIEGDYHLSEDSPCIDAGDPNYVSEPNETDLDGNPRVSGDRIDMGAYEFTVINIAPVACIVGGDMTVEVGSGCEAKVTLDGSCSSDADSTPGTNDDIDYFDWYEVIDPCDPNSDIFLGSGEVIECNLPLSEHDIILEVTDKACAFDANEVTITVEDTTPPEFSLTVEPSVLWPANHKMVEITPSWEVSDNCDEWPEVTLVGISSNEDNDSKGGGHTKNGIKIGNDGSIYLRAERSGKGTGRVYTITYQAVDDSGNVTVQEVAVTVPHDRRKPK
ncbi:MAG: right-handed parallel beta-helix repeat-containing protein [Planctomycetota bacterium]